MKLIQINIGANYTTYIDQFIAKGVFRQVSRQLKLIRLSDKFQGYRLPSINIFKVGVSIIAKFCGVHLASTDYNLDTELSFLL